MHLEKPKLPEKTEASRLPQWSTILSSAIRQM